MINAKIDSCLERENLYCCPLMKEEERARIPARSFCIVFQCILSDDNLC